VDNVEMILLKPGADPDMGVRVAAVIDKIRRFDEEFCTQTFLTELNGVIPDPTQVRPSPPSSPSFSSFFFLCLPPKKEGVKYIYIY
jgi:hypothetical protein